MMATRTVPDMNLVPPEYRRRLVSRAGLLLLLVALVGLALLWPLSRAFAGARESLSVQQARLEDLKRQEGKLLALEPEVKELRALLDKEEQRLRELQGDYQAFQEGRVDWPRLLGVVVERVPQGVGLRSLVQKGGNLEVKGSAGSLPLVARYGQALNESGLFASVQTSLELEDQGVSFTLVLKPGGAGR